VVSVRSSLFVLMHVESEATPFEKRSDYSHANFSLFLIFVNFFRIFFALIFHFFLHFFSIFFFPFFTF